MLSIPIKWAFLSFLGGLPLRHIALKLLSRATDPWLCPRDRSGEGGGSNPFQSPSRLVDGRGARHFAAEFALGALCEGHGEAYWRQAGGFYLRGYIGHGIELLKADKRAFFGRQGLTLGTISWMAVEQNPDGIDEGMIPQASIPTRLPIQ